MRLTIEPEAPPLRVDEAGAVRVGNTRVVLALVLRAYQRGETPERIVEMFDTLALGDVYAVIGHYLRHRPEVDAYLAEYERRGDEIRREIEESQRHLPDLRARMLARRAEREARFHQGSDAGSVGEPIVVRGTNQHKASEAAR